MRKDDKDGVKKYRVSHITGTVLAANLVFAVALGLLFTVIIMIADVEEGIEWFVYMNYGVLFFSIACLIISMLTGMAAYRFSISYTGITMYEPKHVYEFSWDEFVDYGIAVANMSASDTQNSFWIYFAKRNLRESEKCSFLIKLGKKHDYIAYFQYSPEIYEEVKQYIPSEWREQIDWELEPWIENMTFTEKRINR